MKLEKILDNLNSFEKNSFLKIIDNLIANNRKNAKEVESILSDPRDLKNIDNINIVKVFSLLENEFYKYVQGEFVNTTSQLDILIDIIIRDGNSIMKQDWFARQYEEELKKLDKKLKEFSKVFEDDYADVDSARIRDYNIYRKCLETAFRNDIKNNQDSKITYEEQSILLTLSSQLDLSQEEIKLINYLILPVNKLNIDALINDLKNSGIVFYSKKNNTIYIAEEVVRVLRKVRGKEIADKFARRVLRCLREPQINLICKKHNIDRKLTVDEKIKSIIQQGISLTGILKNDIHKEGLTLTEKKKALNEFFDKSLKINPPLKGVTIDEKIANLITYFEVIEKDDKIGISIDGYEKLLLELGETLPHTNKLLKSEFLLQDELVLRSNYLLDYNIKPRDILELLTPSELETFCVTREIKARGDIVVNILDAYKDAENLHLENYVHIGCRNLNQLKENGINIKEAELGMKFEDLTKLIFSKLGFEVDEKLRKSINTNKDQIDIILNLGNSELILVECKSVKESGYNKFSAVSRQLKAYNNLAQKNNFKVVKSLLIAPEFSDEFIKDCGLDYELNLSLITASALVNILQGFKNSKHKQFPHNLLMRDVLIQEQRILKAIER